MAEALGVLASIIAIHEAGHFTAARLQVSARACALVRLRAHAPSAR